jgi:excisionase family DNA binding protein
MNDYMKIPEVAELLKISISKTYDYAKRGLIPSVRIGRSVRTKRSDLEKWLEERKEDGQYMA